MRKATKHRILSAALALLMCIGCLPMTVNAVGSSTAIIQKAYVDQAAYTPGSLAEIMFDVYNGGEATTKTAHITISHLQDIVWENSVSFYMDAYESKTISTVWSTPTVDFRGYLVQIKVDGNTAVTAIDVSSDSARYPRYGYTVDFLPGETAAESDEMMRELAQVYHINLVQYYDWMYRHEKILPDTGDEFTDMFGHTLSRSTIQQRIDAGHKYNQKAMAYQMSYMAREGYEAYGVDKEWGLYADPTGRNIAYDSNDNATISGIDQFIFPLEGKPAPILFTFNPLNRQWQNFMGNQFCDAVNELGFDGIQIDQMGDFWGSNIAYYDYAGNRMDLGASFAPFTNAVKDMLTANNPKKNIVTMNAVNGGSNDYFSSSSIISEANTNFAFSELWGNSDTYKKIQDFVTWQRMNDGGKTMVLAAYMNQYDINGSTYSYMDAQLTGVHTGSDPWKDFITGFDEVGDRAELTITVPEDGNYSLVFYAANGTDTQASKSIYVDGVKYMTAYFDSTRDGIIPTEPSWYHYSYEASFTMPKNLYLTAGTHTLTIQQDEDDIGGDIRLNSVTLGTYDEDSVRLTNAAIAASGAMHIELGSGMSTTSNGGGRFNDVSLLGAPYYPKAAKSMRDGLKDAMRNHYQFITAYENLLYDADVLPSDSGMQCFDIQEEHISGDARPGSIWYTIKNKGNEYGIIHLINLTGEDNEDWRDVTGTPETKYNLTLKYYLPQYKSVQGVYLASPDTDCVSTPVNYQIGSDGNGTYITIDVPVLEYWDMVYIHYGDETSPERIEAEDAILCGVNFADNHIGYSGRGFVDSYGEMGDSVTMDFYIPAEGDYALNFVYSATVHQNPVRQLYINGYGYEDVVFPVTNSWDEWAETSTTIHLRKGINRLVLYVGGSENGYLNLDYITVTPAH